MLKPSKPYAENSGCGVSLNESVRYGTASAQVPQAERVVAVHEDAGLLVRTHDGSPLP